MIDVEMPLVVLYAELCARRIGLQANGDTLKVYIPDQRDAWLFDLIKLRKVELIGILPKQPLDRDGVS